MIKKSDIRLGKTTDYISSRLEEFKNKVLELSGDKKIIKINKFYAIGLVNNTWIFAIRNRIRVKSEDWEIFKMKVIKGVY